MATKTITPRHQWTHDGKEILIVKTVSKDGTTYGGFKFPLTVGATVKPDTWNPKPECGDGIHGWPWGFCLGDGKEPDYSETWVVIGALPADVVDLNGKVKTRTATVRYVGTWDGAMSFVLAGQMAWVAHAADGAASATGERGAASATGERGAASATGGRGAASATGERGAASATGERGAASATGGRGAAAVTGLDGRAQAGAFGCIALAWWNPKAKRQEMRCARIGNGKDRQLKPNVWYVLSASGKFVPVKE